MRHAHVYGRWLKLAKVGASIRARAVLTNVGADATQMRFILGSLQADGRLGE